MNHGLKKVRNVQMTALTIFATVLVVAGHCDITQDYKNLWIFKWVYSFHMPLFFFISGYIFCLTNPEKRLKNTKWKDFVGKKTYRLIIPFLVIDSIIFIIKASLFSDGSMVQHPVEFSFESFFLSIFISPLGFMWFLPALFMIFLIVFPIWKYSNQKPGYVLALISFGIYIVAFFSTLVDYNVAHFMQFSRALYYFSFFWSGVLYCRYSAKVNCYLRSYWLPIVLICGLLSISLTGNNWVRAFTGITFSSVLALMVADYIPDSILDLGMFTYTIFLLSYFPQMIIRGPVHSLIPSVNQYWLSGLSFIMGLTLPVVFVIVYRKLSKKIPILDKLKVVFGL